MRKILFALIGCFAVFCAHAAQVVNVDYVHKLIAQKWDISVPIKTNNIMAVANMKYLLTAVDVANEILNGEKTTDYGNGEFATLQVADTVATIQAVDTLVKQNKIEYKFFMDIDLSQYGDNQLGTATVTEFGFDISAAGTFYIDWGDGTTETIKKADTNPVTYSHDYGTATGVFRVGIGGRATDYSDNTYTSVLGFSEQPGPMSELREAITNIDGSLGAIFGTLADGSQPSFYYMFDSTPGVKKIPDNLFKGIHGDLVDGMFQGTFSYCYFLTGPSARIDGLYLYEIWPDATEEQVGGMYAESSGLSDYECIPVAWGGLGVEDCSLPYEFYLETENIDSFSFNISAAGEFIVNWGDGTVETITKADTTDTTYSHTYSTSKSYTIKLAGQATAYNTNTSTATISFYSSASSIASIDGSLGAIFGTLADGSQPIFYQTFYNAINMTGSIPSDLFAGISGAPASNMFYRTFRGCGGLTGAIPDGLFGNLTGAPAGAMFYQTFYGCSGLISIPENLFGNISGTAQNGMFYYMFSYCTSLNGPSARINGKYLYEIWPSATSSQVGDMYYNATGLDDYRCIPTTWGGGGEYCSAPTAEFTLTTTPDTNSFSFKISAAGTFYIDWGDGTTEIVTKTDTTDTTYSHTYSTAGAYTIGIGGQATAYNADIYKAAISFNVNSSQIKIASIDGSLGAIFGTLTRSANKQPIFYQTFYNAYNMKGSIPSDLFAGISGAPASNMFLSTFSGCSGLTGAIPDGLFGNLTGAPASSMFRETFYGCSGLTGAIPAGLFAGISGAPASRMFESTFQGCTGLTSIPSDLFAGISGAPASYMFLETFSDCSGLTSIPENLFGNISGTAQSMMFYKTFYNCTSLTGPSARINGQYLYEIWPDATSTQVGDMYYSATGLSDYATMPTVWK